jgi:hypothetical protein
MARQKFDGVIEAVRLTPEGLLVTARAYLRRGPTYSDRLLVDRDEIVDRLRSGQKWIIGKRCQYLASTFDSIASLKLIEIENRDIIALDKQAGNHLQSTRDYLEGTLLF